MRCKLCNKSAEMFGSTRVMGRFDAAYYQCASCGFLFVGDPHWLEEAYTTAITGIDIGTVNRAITNARAVKAVIDTFFDRDSTFLDYGAGYGMFVRRMRDLGYDFRYHDKHCENLFAKSHETDPAAAYGQCEMVTSFEVFEHLVEPLADIEAMLGCSRTILFSTELLPDPAPPLGSWDYYHPEHGQHISFYSRRSLAQLARRLGLHFHTNGTNFHLFTPVRLPDWVFRFVIRRRICGLIEVLRPRPTLLYRDFQEGVTRFNASLLMQQPGAPRGGQSEASVEEAARPTRDESVVACMSS